MINNIELTLDQREFFEGLMPIIDNANVTPKEKKQLKMELIKEIPNIIKEMDDDTENDTVALEEGQITDFLKIMSKIEEIEDPDNIPEEDIETLTKFFEALMSDEDDEDDVCPWCCSDCDNCDNNINYDMSQVYDFRTMIKEFEKGYEGLFTDGINVYGYNSGTLLEIFESGVQPADIKSDMLTRLYIKKEVIKVAPIDNDDILAYVLDGDVVNFTLDINGMKATGTLSCKNGIPSYKIDNQTGMNNSDLILLALFKGKWTL